MSGETIDNETGEFLTGSEMTVSNPSGSLIAQIMRAEIDAQVATAHAFPRKPALVVKALDALVTMSVESAQECIYSLPRGGKPIRGPSVRFAEALFQSWGNAMVEAKVTHVDREEKVVIAEASYRDLETGAWTRASTRRRISGTHGKIFSDDMIIMTGNAACSIARRNVTLAGIPKLVWGAAFEKAQDTVAGKAEPIAVTREKAVSAFATYGIKPEQVYAAIGINGPEEVQRDHIITLRGMFSTIKNEEATIEEVFNLRAPGAPGPKVAGVADPLGNGDKTTRGVHSIIVSYSGDKSGLADFLAANPQFDVNSAKDAKTAIEMFERKNKEPATAREGVKAEGSPAKSPASGEADGGTSQKPSADQSKKAAEEPSGRAVSGEDAEGGSSAKQEASSASDQSQAQDRPKDDADKPKRNSKKDAPAAEDAAGPAEPEKVAPKTEADYMVHARAFIAAATNGTALDAAFKHRDERNLRTAVNISTENLAVLKQEVAARITELNGDAT